MAIGTTHFPCSNIITWAAILNGLPDLVNHPEKSVEGWGINYHSMQPTKQTKKKVGSAKTTWHERDSEENNRPLQLESFIQKACPSVSCWTAFPVSPWLTQSRVKDHRNCTPTTYRFTGSPSLYPCFAPSYVYVQIGEKPNLISAVRKPSIIFVFKKEGQV